ncbi:hypothetical protein MMC10_001977 [Thelotrema lepadinum]|nr:hypothetical protein [Thelotrema lepadinum]
MVIEPEAIQNLMATIAPGPSPSNVSPIPSVTPGPVFVDPQEASEVGRRSLWVVFVIMVISSLAMYTMAYRVPASKRLFHIITAFITTFAAISYYAMAVGDGVYDNVIKFTESHGNGIPDTYYYQSREVYWARYVDWSVTTPLLLLDLSFLAGLSGANILVAVVADLVMILTGLFAGLAKDDSVSWGYYAMACIAYLVVVYQLAFNGRAAVAGKDSKTATFFTSIAGFTLLLWTAYPIIWGVADGSRILAVDGEIIGYAVLDVLAKPVFGFWLLFTHDAMASTSISLGGFWSHGLTSEGGIRVGDDDEGA